MMENVNDDINNYFIISKSTIIDNYLKLKNVNHNLDVGIVLKSDAYGIGFVKDLAILLNKNGQCKSFFVGSMTEAESIKSSLACSDFKIYLLYNNFTEHLADACKKNNIIPVINSLNQLNKWINYASKLNEKFRIALKLDSGMNRMGLRVTEISNELINLIRKFLDLDHVMTHLACGGSVNDKNSYQLKLFTKIKDEFFQGVSSSISASNFLTSKLDPTKGGSIVRLGGGLYGLYQKSIREHLSLNLAINIKARVLNIFNINAGDTVGYGATFTAEKPMRLATLCIGYADGFPHSAGNGAFSVRIENKLAYTVGVVSMNITVFDITELEKQELAEGDFVNIIETYEDLYKIKELIGTTTILDAFCGFSKIKNKFFVE